MSAEIPEGIESGVQVSGSEYMQPIPPIERTSGESVVGSVLAESAAAIRFGVMAVRLTINLLRTGEGYLNNNPPDNSPCNGSRGSTDS